jgi:hypothetical protein
VRCAFEVSKSALVVRNRVVASDGKRRREGDFAGWRTVRLCLPNQAGNEASQSTAIADIFVPGTGRKISFATGPPAGPRPPILNQRLLNARVIARSSALANACFSRVP